MLTLLTLLHYYQPVEPLLPSPPFPPLSIAFDPEFSFWYCCIDRRAAAAHHLSPDIARETETDGYNPHMNPTDIAWGAEVSVKGLYLCI